MKYKYLLAYPIAFSFALLSAPKSLAIVYSNEFPSKQKVESDTKDNADLINIISQAVENNIQVKLKKSQLTQSHMLSTKTKLNLLPSLTYSTGTTQTSPSGTNNPWLSFNQISANVNIFKFGADVYAIQSANAATEAAQYDLEETRLTIEENIASKIISVVAAKKETEIRKNLFLRQQKYFQIAQERFSKGLLSRQELEQITIDLNNDETLLSDAEIKESETISDLKIFLDPSLLNLNEWPWLDNVESGKFILKDSLHNISIPIIRKAELELEQSTAEKKIKLAKTFPNIDLQASYNSNNSLGSASQVIENNFWTTSVTLTMYLFNQGNDFYDLEAAREQESKADNLLHNIRHLEDSEKTKLESKLKAEVKSLLNRKNTQKLSYELFQANIKKFKLGRLSTNDILNDQIRLSDSQFAITSAYRSLYTTTFKYCHTIGLSIKNCIVVF